MMKINELLAGIDQYAGFAVINDIDEVLISIGAGGEIPVVAAWDKNGFRPYDLDGRDYYPIERDEFMEMVPLKEPI